MKTDRLPVPFLLLLATLAAPSRSAPIPPGSTPPAVHVTHRTWIELKVTPINASPAEGTREERFTVKVHPREGGQTEFALVWPEPDSETGLKLRAVQAVSSSDLDHALDLEAELTLPDGAIVLARRHIELDDRATALFEVYRHAERPLTLVIEAEASRETVVSRHPSVGTPVRFLLEIQRVERGKTIPLETNVLQTMEGQAVSYSFQLGSSPDAEAARVSLRPLRVSGTIVEIEVETDGRLPDGDRLLILGRRERWVTSRGATSTLAFESGEPPTGYRFVVTPDF